MSGPTQSTSGSSDNEATVDEYRSVWNWPEDVVEYIQTHMEGSVLNVCSGGSPLPGAINLDRDPAPDGQTASEPDILGDMKRLPFEDGSFATTISDPPWREKSLQMRARLFEELYRVTEPGGRILYNATWKPDHPRTGIEAQRLRQDNMLGANASLLVVLRKHPDDVNELIEFYRPPDDDPSARPPNSRVRDLFPVDQGRIDQWERHRVILTRVDPEQGTDPRLVDSTNTTFRCLNCGHSELVHQGAESGVNARELPYAEGSNIRDDPGIDLYLCPECGFPNQRNEVLSAAASTAFEGVLDDGSTPLGTFDPAQSAVEPVRPESELLSYPPIGEYPPSRSRSARQTTLGEW